MNFKSWKKQKVLNARQLQPQLPVCGEAINALVSQILAAYFPEKTMAPSIYFGRTPTLAHIEESAGEQRTTIWMHHGLNDAATPDYVFAHVLKHELLHTRIRPREVHGKLIAHPPEFWEEENRIAAADKGRAWEWIHRNFAGALKGDSEFECIWVNNRRMKDLLRNRYCAEEDVRHLRDAFTLGHKELRFGFREQALRDFKPGKDS